MDVLVRGCLLLILLVVFVRSSLIPTYKHLYLTGDPSVYQITFSTSSLPTTPGVAYWPTNAPNKVSTVYASKSNIFLFPHPTTGKMEYIVSLPMKSLEKAASYSYYVFGDYKNASTKSAVLEFHSLPDPDTTTINIGLYGDLGAYGTALEDTGYGGLVHWAQSHEFDFVVHNGDLAYNLASSFGAVGEDFLTNIEPISSVIPYLLTPGNHEFMNASEAYYSSWFLGQATLGTSSGSTNPLMWYSFDVGEKLHVVAISTEVYCEDTNNLEVQYAWLQNDLNDVKKRTVQPWVVVFGHRQMYYGPSSAFHARLMRLGLQCQDASLKTCSYTPCVTGVNCGYSLEKLFDDFKIDIFFVGHYHLYQRNFPISSNLTFETQAMDVYYNPQHPVHIISGAAGTQSTAPHIHHPVPVAAPRASPAAVTNDGYSFSYFRVYNLTHVSLDQIEITTGKILDSFFIVKDPLRPVWTKTAPFTQISDGNHVCDQ